LYNGERNTTVGGGGKRDTYTDEEGQR